MKGVFIFLVFLLPLKLLAFPFDVSGKVVDGATKKPISGAQVFINKSSKFSLSDSSGVYRVNDITDTVVELVVYVAGYETLVYKAYAAKPVINLRFEMVPLSTKERKPDSVNAEQEQLFLSHFLGLSPNAYETYVVNPDVLRYKYNVIKGELSVTATDMLHIINDGLGYMINYHLESFTYIVSSGFTIIQGHYFFKELTTKKAAITEKWQERRRNTFGGSLSHFMKSLYLNKITEEGFEVNNVRRVLEGESDYKSAAKSKNLVRSGVTTIDNVEKKFADLIDKSRLTKDFRTADNSTSSVLFSFPGSLLVFFKTSQNPVIGADNTESVTSQDQISLLHLAPAGIRVLSNGLYFETDDLFIEGSMSEKVADLLPVEYSP